MLSVDIKKRFGDGQHPAFSLDVRFSVRNGITALVGASGSGKTTSLRLIAGVLTPDEGHISVGAQTYFDSARRINLSIQSRRIGFVFQDYALFPHLTAEQNIAYGVKAPDRKTRFDKAREMLSLFHIEHARRRFPREISGGEAQRVALARALASDPLVVLLDEPLSAVDVETRTKLLDEIEDAQRKANIPFIYVTHNEAESARLGKHRITLQSGSIVHEETFEETA
ncbi:MAG: ATP-binding cassette domain-containing protein [Rubrivivax sp.]|nr:ATP-binding cassette domain-containing protein [Pyrinomonadaceae bacterium]